MSETSDTVVTFSTVSKMAMALSRVSLATSVLTIVNAIVKRWDNLSRRLRSVSQLALAWFSAFSRAAHLSHITIAPLRQHFDDGIEAIACLVVVSVASHIPQNLQ